ncbi:MAG TPA: RimK family alpha-L-glutamate ligase [Burkholderiaceae bacterium]|nr:RimK family alpha-L-glutamate ligase [Burkholderiaceae bacterium]
MPDAPKELPLMGLAVLMTMACSGTPLTELANQLIERLKHNPRDANALMDLAVISHLWFKHDIGLATQARALQVRRFYRLPARETTKIRLLALMHHGDLAANTPLEFLVQDSDIALDMWYLDPALDMPLILPQHDVLFIAVAESERSHVLLKLIEQQIPHWSGPVLNRPERIARLSRESVCSMLNSLPGIDMPVTVRIANTDLARLGKKTAVLSHVLTDGTYPIILRPTDSHAGHGLAKIDEPSQIVAYMQTRPEHTFSISRFVDYRSPDGLFRKYRIVLVDGQAYAGHMAISEHWMIHYLNANMSDSQEKRDEEAAFMQDFDTGFGARHRQALQAIHQAAGLDYLVIDCAEMQDGRLLVFEIDSAAVIHAMDSAQLFPYKQAQVKKIFSAFHAMLQKAVSNMAA